MDGGHIIENMKFLHSDVAQQTLLVLERLEKTAATVVAAAESVEKNKRILHRQNESFLIGKVNEINDAVGKLSSLETNMRSVSGDLIKPILSEISAIRIKLNSEKPSAKPEDTAALILIIAFAALILGLGAGWGGYMVGKYTNKVSVTTAIGK